MTVPSRVTQLFADQKKAHVAYLTAGDGGIAKTFDAAMALIEGGVNLLELGVPFSDPIADGPVIQRASARAIEANTTLPAVLDLVNAIRQKSDIPLVLFSYLNPILAASNTDFFRAAHAAGVDGLLLVDCPIEESDFMRQACMAHHIDFIQVITPSTPLDRVQWIEQHAQGFLYYACRSGTTGIRDSLPEGFQKHITAIKSVVTLPIVVGFGISTGEMAQQALQWADGVVVGSFFVKALEEGCSLPSLAALARRLYFDGI